jgi:hypothetical protein
MRGALLFSAPSAGYEATPKAVYRVGQPMNQFDRVYIFPNHSVYLHIVVRFLLFKFFVEIQK